jgi:phosphotransferase system HPr (HPr) family protein
VQKKQKLQKVTYISNELGLHARSAAQIAEISKNSKGNVWVMKEAHKADASSIMDLLTLVCEKGTKIRIIIEDPADADILNSIVNLVDNGFGE